MKKENDRIFLVMMVLLCFLCTACGSSDDVAGRDWPPPAWWSAWQHHYPYRRGSVDVLVTVN